MSTKYIVNSNDNPSPSQEYLEKLSSFNNLLCTSSSSYSRLLLADKTEWERSKHPLGKRLKTATRRGFSPRKRSHPGKTFTKLCAGEVAGNPPQKTSPVTLTTNLSKPVRNITVVGSKMGLNTQSTPKPGKVGFPNSSQSKVPSLSTSTQKPAITGEGENAKRQCVLSAVKPSNVEKEKAVFFKSDFSYNPQFQYSNPVSPTFLARHNNASDRFLTQVRMYHKQKQNPAFLKLFKLLTSSDINQ